MRPAANRRVVGFLVLLVLVVGLGALRWLIDRPPGGSLGFAWPEPAWAHFRWKALTAAAIIGSALAVSGVLLQALLRNPLASPFILGLSSGAGLGVMTAMYIGSVTGWAALRTGTNAIPALIGASAALLVVYGLGQRRGWLDPVSLVLIGVVVAAVCGAMTMFLQHLAPGGVRDDMTRWMFGSIRQGINQQSLVVAGGLTVVGIGIAALMGRAMDAATFGDDEARSIGLMLGPLRLAMFALAGLLAALTVSLAGPIGFVGLIAPHAARLLVGPRHGTLVLGAALCGAALIIGADVASQAIPTPSGRMPIGIFTALIGGPAFVWLLRTGRGQA